MTVQATNAAICPWCSRPVRGRRPTKDGQTLCLGCFRRLGKVVYDMNEQGIKVEQRGALHYAINREGEAISKGFEQRTLAYKYVVMEYFKTAGKQNDPQRRHVRRLIKSGSQ